MTEQSLPPFSHYSNIFDKSYLESLEWKPFRKGVEIHRLHEKQAADSVAAAFLKFEPGATIPEHFHVDFEYIIVLHGSQQDRVGVSKAGSLIVNFPNSSHSVVSEEGCIVLAIWSKPVKML